MTIKLTRFAKTPGGYRRLDVVDFDPSAETAQLLTQVATTPTQPAQAWSFCHFNAGKMSSDTWRAGTAIQLEYYLDGKDTPDRDQRLEEIIEGAERTQLGYLIGDTQTRYLERSITLVFPLLEEVTAARYARLASVLAAQVDCWESTPGVIAHSHLSHCHEASQWTWREGGCISPDSFIKLTKDEAQTIDPQQFEKRRPAPQPVEPPASLQVEDGLFSW